MSLEILIDGSRFLDVLTGDKLLSTSLWIFISLEILNLLFTRVVSLKFAA